MDPLRTQSSVFFITFRYLETGTLLLLTLELAVEYFSLLDIGMAGILLKVKGDSCLILQCDENETFQPRRFGKRGFYKFLSL